MDERVLRQSEQRMDGRRNRRPLESTGVAWELHPSANKDSLLTVRRSLAAPLAHSLRPVP